jgi:hypothetical protein
MMNTITRTGRFAADTALIYAQGVADMVGPKFWNALSPIISAGIQTCRVQ